MPNNAITSHLKYPLRPSESLPKPKTHQREGVSIGLVFFYSYSLFLSNQLCSFSLSLNTVEIT